MWSFVSFLIAFNYHMRFQTIFSRTTEVANLTFVEFLLAVDSYMSLQMTDDQHPTFTVFPTDS